MVEGDHGNGMPDVKRVDVDPTKLEGFSSEEDFNGLSVDLLVEVGSYVCIAYSLLPASTKRWNRDQAIIGGNMVRLYKLICALLDQTCQRRRMTAFIFGRLAFETIVNIAYLIEFGSPELFDLYVQHSLKHERRLYDRIRENIAARGGEELQIETRMLASIDRACRKSGVTISNIKASGAGNWGGKNLYEKAEAVGLNYIYLGVFGGPSRNVHGSWADLMEYHLDYEDDEQLSFAPEPLWHRPRPQLLFTIARLTVPVVQRYFAHVTAEPDVFADELQDLAERISTADSAHELFLQKPG